jgi:hypothetical protein
MSITYTELKNAVVGQLEIDADDAARYELDGNLAAAQVGILNALPFRYLKNAITTTKATLTTAIFLYQWPSDFVRLVEIWFNHLESIDPADGKHGNKALVHDGENSYIQNIAKIATKRYPVVDLEVEDGYGVYPVPDVTVTNGIRIRYVWRIPNPTSTQDCLLEYNLRNLMVYRATSLCALVDEFNVALSAKMEDLYAKELQTFLPKRGKV